MKIFVPTGTHPSKDSSPIIYIKNILKNLKSTTCIWFLYQPQKIENKNDEIIEIYDYSNAIDVLQKIKPDCVITNNNKYDVIDYAFSIAAKYLKITLVNYKVVDLSENEEGRNFKKINNNFKRNFQKILSKDSETNESRSSFILLKNKFLFETEKKLGKNNSENIKSQIENILFHFIGNPKKRFTDLADVQLINNKIWWKFLSESGVSENKMILTGNPYWDTLYDKSQKKGFSKDPITHLPIKVLILTTPILEHEHWSENQREKFLSELVENLEKQTDVDFTFKIHPSSEKIETYQKYLKKFGIKAKIFQKESFWDIVNDFDVIVSYGYTTTHSEIALIGYRMILLNISQELREMPLVNSALESGFVKRCKNLSELSKIIKIIIQEKIQFHKNHEKEIEKILFKFDGNSGKRAAEVITHIVEKKKS